MRHEQILQVDIENTFKEIDGGNDPYPRIIEIHPTDVCNQGCDYCFHGGKGFGDSRDPSKYLKGEQITRFIEEMTQLGIHELSISGGGEPFLSKDMGTLLSVANINNINTRIVTNGNFIPDNMLSSIADCSEIRLSMDTVDPKTYSEIRNVKPTLLAATIENIKKIVLIKKNKQTNLQIGATFIVNSQNQEQIVDFASMLLEEIGIDKVIYKYDVYGKYVPNGDQNLIRESLQQVINRWGPNVDVRKPLDGFVSGLPCVVPYFKSVVNPYGDVYSCCLGSQPGEVNGFYLGSINQDAFADVWKNSKPVRNQMLKGVKCIDCNFTDREINESYKSFHK